MFRLTPKEKEITSSVIGTVLTGMNEMVNGNYQADVLISFSPEELELLQSAFTKVSE